MKQFKTNLINLLTTAPHLGYMAFAMYTIALLIAPPMVLVVAIASIILVLQEGGK